MSQSGKLIELNDTQRPARPEAAEKLVCATAGPIGIRLTNSPRKYVWRAGARTAADDYRATAKLIPAGLSTIPASTHDPLNMQRVGNNLQDTWGHWSYFINYDSAEVIIVSDVVPCNAQQQYVPPDTAGFSKTGTKYEICLEEGDVNGGTLAHEVGHSCGLGHNNANADNVMYKTTAGNETLLTQSEAAAFE